MFFFFVIGGPIFSSVLCIEFPIFFFVVVVESPDIHGHVSSWPSARSYYWDISFSIYRLLCRLTLSIPESSSTKNLGRLSIDRAKIALPRTYAFGSLGGEIVAEKESGKLKNKRPKKLLFFVSIRTTEPVKGKADTRPDPASNAWTGDD